jgi:hypothetical protein
VRRDANRPNGRCGILGHWHNVVAGCPAWSRSSSEGASLPESPGRTVIVALCGASDKDEVLNAAVEFTGDGIAALPIDDRLTIANGVGCACTIYSHVAGMPYWNVATGMAPLSA